MKKIGILTFHYADNHGAVLQTYALYKTINDFMNCQAEIINYVPKGYGYLVMANSSMVEMKKEKRKKFNKFLFEKCGIVTPMIQSVTGNEYDIYLAGSDQIWNMDLAEAATDYEYLFPNINAEAKRIAYSASIGMEIERINQKLFQKYLPKFESISLRERSYVEIISKLSGRRCEYTLDPTMLLSERKYEAIIEKPDTGEEPFILYFWYDMGDGGLESFETVNALARKYGLMIRHTFLEDSVVRKLLVNDGGYMLQCGIGEFLWYVKNAQVIVTNSFHGVIFAILFKKPLYIYYPQMRKCRQENIVNLLQIQDRVIQGYICPDNLNLEMDYDSVFSVLDKEREHSISYLKSALKII